jgi:hypothetical protein
MRYCGEVDRSSAVSEKSLASNTISFDLNVDGRAKPAD